MQSCIFEQFFTFLNFQTLAKTITLFCPNAQEFHRKQGLARDGVELFKMDFLSFQRDSHVQFLRFLLSRSFEDIVLILIPAEIVGKGFIDHFLRRQLIGQDLVIVSITADFWKC